MFGIEMHEMSPEFKKCWHEAGTHLNSQVQGGIQSWLKAYPYPPFLEHLSFRIGNQLFFVRVEDIDGKVEGPGSLRGLHAVAEGNLGHACLMPMKKKLLGGRWSPVERGWGLICAKTKKLLDPFFLVTTEKIEMTPWELQDMAVQVVRQSLEKDGYQFMSWHSNPAVDPSIWFVGDSKGPEWVVVRETRYPSKRALRPTNWQEIARQSMRMSPIGHFASVAMASVDQRFESDNEKPVPLWRGYGIHVNFAGLE
jgi:hypothetical protein